MEYTDKNIKKIESTLKSRCRGFGLKLVVVENTDGTRQYHFEKRCNPAIVDANNPVSTLTLDEAIDFMKKLEDERTANDYLEEMHRIYKVSYEVFLQQYLDELETGADFDTIKRNLWKRYRNDID